MLISNYHIYTVLIYNLGMHELSIREKALALRKDGFSYTYISSKTGLSKSTLSGWLAEIPYAPNKETITAFGRARAAASARRAKLRQESIQEIRKVAIKDIGEMTERSFCVWPRPLSGRGVQDE